MKNLTDEQKQFFGAMEGTFRTPGWDLLKTGWQVALDSIPETVFHNAKSMDDIYAARVRYELLTDLISLPSEIARQREEILSDPENDDYNV